MFFRTMSSGYTSFTGQTCVDIKDNVVNEGYYFTPKGDDPCLSCTCHDGEPEMCVAALCERPQGCQHFRKDPKECCKFTCLDPGTFTSQSQQVELLTHRQCEGVSLPFVFLFESPILFKPVRLRSQTLTGLFVLISFCLFGPQMETACLTRWPVA